MNLKRIVSGIILIILLAIVSFYFYGSSSHHNKAEYNRILNFERVRKSNSSDTLSIMTYNLGYLSGMTNNLAVESSEDLYINNLATANKMLKAAQPDFLAFQEIDFGSSRSFMQQQLEEIASENYYAFGAMAVNWDKRYVPFPFWPPSTHFGKMLSGQALLSNYKILENEIVVLEKPKNYPFYYNAFYIDRLAQIVSISINNRIVKVINVHLEAFEADTRINQARVVLSIYQDLVKVYPVFVVGDFNSRPPFASDFEPEDEALIPFFEEPGLGVAISETQYLKAESNYFTFNSQQPSQKLDYIFYSKRDIIPIGSRVVKDDVQASDHLPVIFQFKWR